MKTERTMTELIAAIRGGDQDAFTELYERTSQEVYRTARAVLRDEEAALDVQQDTFVYAYQHLDQLSEPEKLRPWLRSIAMNRAKTLLRRNTPVLFTELENDEGEGLPEQADLSLDASPELSLERKETAELVNEILSGLSDGQRAAVAMYYYEQMSVNEIADALGVNVSTVGAQLFRGRKKIEEAVRALEKKGVKLYGLSPVGFLVALMKKQAPTAQAGQAVLAKTLAKAGLSAGAKSAAAAAVTAAPVTTSTFGHVLAGRLVAGVLAVALIGGGIWGGAKLLKSSNTDAPYQPTTSVTDERMAGVETPEELTETVVPETEAVAAPTDATVNSVTDPVATEPKETEPTTRPTEVSVYEDTNQNLWIPEETEPEPDETGEFVPDPSWETGSCGENLTWYYDDKTCQLTITGSGAMDDYTSSYETFQTPWNLRVKWVKSVRLLDGVTSIGDYAFQGCTDLTRVTIPDSVRSIGKGAFARCNFLTEMTIPDGVTSIGDVAFASCERLKTVTIPDGVTSIGIGAFRGCTALTSVTIPDSVTSIGEGAFSSCKALKSVAIQGSVTSIGSCAFEYCEALTSVTIGGEVTSIGIYAFGYCKSLTEMTIPDGVTSIGDLAFVSCERLKTVTIPDSVTSIGRNAFAGCCALTSVTIPDSVTSIGKGTFQGCGATESFEVGADNPSYSSLDGVLFDKKRTELLAYPAGKKDASYAIPEGVKRIANYAFGNCIALQNVTIPDSVTELGHYTFCNCGELKSIVISGGVTSIGSGAFQDCTALTSITIPDSVTSIGESAFLGCTALKSITIPDSVTSIGWEAFFACDLPEVTIPASVTKIGGKAFGYTYLQSNPHQYEGFTIHGKAGTAAQSYADANGFAFVAE